MKLRLVSLQALCYISRLEDNVANIVQGEQNALLIFSVFSFCVDQYKFDPKRECRMQIRRTHSCSSLFHAFGSFHLVFAWAWVKYVWSWIITNRQIKGVRWKYMIGSAIFLSRATAKSLSIHRSDSQSVVGLPSDNEAVFGRLQPLPICAAVSAVYTALYYIPLDPYYPMPQWFTFRPQLLYPIRHTLGGTLPIFCLYPLCSTKLYGVWSDFGSSWLLNQRWPMIWGNWTTKEKEYFGLRVRVKHSRDWTCLEALFQVRWWIIAAHVGTGLLFLKRLLHASCCVISAPPPISFPPPLFFGIYLCQLGVSKVARKKNFSHILQKSPRKTTFNQKWTPQKDLRWVVWGIAKTKFRVAWMKKP